MRQTPNGIAIGLAVFGQYISVTDMGQSPNDNAELQRLRICASYAHATHSVEF